MFKRLGLLLGCLSVAGAVANAAVVTFTFENGESIPGGSVYGSSEGYPTLVRDGFVIDVQDQYGSHNTVHWHEIANPADAANKIPGTRPGVLWRDSLAGQDPLFFAPATPTFVFSLESLLLSASAADNSQTYAVRLSAFLNGNNLASVDLPALDGDPQYASFSGAALGGLQGLNMDRLEVIGLSTSAISYYQLDDVTFQTTAVPEPGILAWSLVSGLGLAGLVLHRRGRVAKPE